MKTNKTIRNLISPVVIDEETKMVLVNAINFDNNWMFPFEKECTHYDNFYISENETVRVQYMCSLFPRRVMTSPVYGYAYLHDLQASAIELYFGTTSFALLIIFPDKRTGLVELETKLKDYNISKIEHHIFNHNLYLTIPKFEMEMEFDFELKDILEKVITSHFI